MVFLRVRIITVGGEATSSAMIPSSVGWPAMPMHRFDRFGVDVLALVEPVVEADQHVAGAGRGVGLALDLHPVAARGDVHAEAVLDRDQVAVVLAEQRAEQVGLLELELEPGAAGIVGGRRRGRGWAIRRPPAVRSAPARLLGPALTRVTSSMSPIAASVSTMDRLQPGRLADHLAGLAALAFDQHLGVLADARAVEGELLLVERVPEAAAAARPSPRGAIWSSMVAAGVPGRGLNI